METKEEMFLKYEFAQKMLETEIKILIEEFIFKHDYNPVEHIKTRIKDKNSILNKLKDKGYPVSVSSIKKYIHDVVGIRIVVSFLSDVYDFVSLIKSTKNLIIVDQKDYIAEPKETGYISYHLNVLVPVYLSNKVEYMEAEIQIRTMAMDFWASLDHKIQYKFPVSIPEEVNQAMYQNSLIIKELDKRMMYLNELVNKYDKR